MTILPPADDLAFLGCDCRKIKTPAKMTHSILDFGCCNGPGILAKEYAQVTASGLRMWASVKSLYS